MAMCADMINGANPGIRQQCMAECGQQLERKAGSQQQEKAGARLNIKDMERQIVNAFKKVFH